MREQSSQAWMRVVGIGLSGVLLLWVVAGAAQAQTPTRSATPTHSATPLPTASSTPSPTALPVCGDHKVEGVEECDDGNAFGGDGCSANCTFETPHIFAIDPERSNFVLQTRLASPLVHPPLGASFELVTGNPGPDGRIPVAIPLNGISIAPVQNLGACTCFRPVAVPQLFGNNNAGAGWINCAGAAPVDFAMTQDHSTGATDPECAATDEQTNDFACLEDATSPPACNPLSPHDGTCNGPLRAIGSGTGPTGSAVFWVAMSVSVVLGPDVAGCEPHPGVAAYGDDGLPCTNDDPGQRPARIIPLTTGRASSVISNTDDMPGQSIAAGELCGQAGCDVVATGAPFDCLALAAANMGEAQTTNDDVFDGAALGMSVPVLDAIDGVAKDVAISYWLNTTNGPTTTPTATWTVTMTPTNTPIITPSATFTPTVTKTPTRTKTPTETRTPPPTKTPTRTPTGRLESPTPTSAASPSPTMTATPRPSSTPSAQPTPTTPVPSPTPTRQPPSPSATPSAPSPTPTEAHSATPTASPTVGILLGDANGDGAVTSADVSALIGQIFNGAARLESDANQDTRVNAADISATIMRL